MTRLIILIASLLAFAAGFMMGLVGFAIADPATMAQGIIVAFLALAALVIAENRL